MKKTTRLAIAVGSTLAASSALAPIAVASDNPFSLTTLAAGYQLAQADGKQKDGKCGEAKCGAEKKTKQAACGAEKAKEGKCAADKKAKEGKCGADKSKDGKCGSDKK